MQVYHVQNSYRQHFCIHGDGDVDDDDDVMLIMILMMIMNVQKGNNK